MSRIYFAGLALAGSLSLVSCTQTSTKDAQTTSEDTLPATTEAVTQETDNFVTPQYLQGMKVELIKLPYAANALEPVISEETINLHHGKHLNAYVTTLNSLIEGTDFANKDLVEIVRTSEGKMFNQAGQTLNHNLYFLQFAPKADAKKKPEGDLLAAIEKKWGSFDKFKEEMTSTAAGIFGSGWAFLATNKAGDLSIEVGKNAENPVTNGLEPLVAIDVWEHAYYVDYKNVRADHLKAIWDIIDWKVVEDRYAKR